MRYAHSRPTRPSLILLAFLLFMCLPALFAMAEAEIPTSKRAERAIDAQHATLTSALQDKGLEPGARLFLQITKQPAQLTAYVETEDGTYTAFRSWPICSYSGGLGPKIRQGDGKSPEGVYLVPAAAMNPASSYHLSFNLGYPNTFDRSHGRTGDYLMVHGNCVSIGCYAMTDPVIEEIWTLMTMAYEGGQTAIPVHIFPFEMTAANLMSHAGSEHLDFWRDLALIWRAFETRRQVPHVRVAGGRYIVSGVQ